jgi:biopolymer transport protein ExbB/TolQ
MFLNAGIAGKLGMIGVLAASIVCWAIIIQKLVLRRARKPGDERSSSSWPE